MPPASRRRRTLSGALSATALVLGLGHVLFGLGNFRPGYPLLEGVAAVVAGVSLLVAAVLVWRSVRRALLTAALGTLPLVAWFLYGVGVEGSSDPVFIGLSLVVPSVAGAAYRALERRRRDDRADP